VLDVKQGLLSPNDATDCYIAMQFSQSYKHFQSCIFASKSASYWLDTGIMTLYRSARVPWNNLAGHGNHAAVCQNALYIFTILASSTFF